MTTDESTEKPEILIVDDSRVIRRAAVKMLGDAYEIREAVDGMDGWDQVQQNTAISVVFTDMQMPEMNGKELLEKIRASDDERINQLAVIILTGQTDTEDTKKEMFDAGATDFIGKPFESIDLISRAKSYAHLVSQVSRLEKQTGVDKLTGLFNAEHHQQRVDQALSAVRRHQYDIAMAHLEIVDFKSMAVKHGKSIAQQIIKIVAGKLQQNIRSEDSAARIGVASFALLLPMTNEDTAEMLIRRLHQVVNSLVFEADNEKIRVDIAAGISAPQVTEALTFDVFTAQTQNALQTALQLNDDKVISFKTEKTAQSEPYTERDVQLALSNVIAGKFEAIPPQLLPVLMRQLSAFMQYAEQQNPSQLTGTDTST